MKRLIILRHGETEWNRKERFRGLADLSLTERGLQQARAAAERIAPLKPQFIYSSPLKRALQTASAVGSSLGLPVFTEEGLRDVDYGLWQGLSLGETYQKFRKDYFQWLHSPEKVGFPQGESLSLVHERVKDVLKNLDKRHEEESVLLVTHKVVCKILVLTLLGLELSHFWQIQMDVAALNHFEKRGIFLMAWAINDTCHSKSLQSKI